MFAFIWPQALLLLQWLDIAPFKLVLNDLGNENFAEKFQPVQIREGKCNLQIKIL